MNDKVQEEICARIARVLADKDIYDPEGYETLANLKLPGRHYLQVLAALHRVLQPKLYLEIGVHRGMSLRLASPATKCIAIDPEPIVEHQPVNTLLAITTSDKFFASDAQRARAKGFDLAFIDGDHNAEQARRDFENLEGLAGPHSVIVLHDVIPMDERTAQPVPSGPGSFWSGDVWRLMAGIVDGRPDLVAFTVACPPSGLGIIGRFGNAPWRGAVTPLLACGFPAEWAEQRRLLNIVPNDPQSILAAFKAAA